MNIEEIAMLLENNKNNLKDGACYKRILNRGCNLLRFDPINRLLIDIQNKKAFDIKSEQEWFNEGRSVIDRKKVVYILIPRKVTSYIDSETKRELEDNELSSVELSKAVELGIVDMVENTEELYFQEMYDIMNTRSIKKKAVYKVSKIHIGKMELVNILRSELNCDVRTSKIDAMTSNIDSHVQYNHQDNTLYITNTKYKILATELINILYNEKLKTDLYNVWNTLPISSDTEYSEVRDLAERSLKYSIYTLLGVPHNKDTDIKESELSKFSVDIILNIINSVDIIISDLLNYIDFNKNMNRLDVSSNVNTARKAEAILTAYDACRISNMTRGM
jgi:hypothetical protein